MKKTCDHGLYPHQHCALCMHEGKGARPLPPADHRSYSEIQLNKAFSAIESLRQQLAESLEARSAEVDKRDELLTKYEALQQQLAESERQREELVKLMQLLRSTLREVLWIATVWNDHNHSAETIRRKASNIARDLGVKREDDSAEKLLNQIDTAIAGQK